LTVDTTFDEADTQLGTPAQASCYHISGQPKTVPWVLTGT
jgi:hypothetical protein